MSSSLSPSPHLHQQHHSPYFSSDGGGAETDASSADFHLSQARTHIYQARNVLLNHDHNFADVSNNNKNEKNRSGGVVSSARKFQSPLDLRARHHRFAQLSNKMKTRQVTIIGNRIDDLPSNINDPDGFAQRSRKSTLDLYPTKSSSECPIILRDRNQNDEDEENNEILDAENADGNNVIDAEDEFLLLADPSSAKPKFPYLERKTDPTPTPSQIKAFFQQSFYSYPKVLAMSDLIQEDQEAFLHQQEFEEYYRGKHPNAPVTDMILNWNRTHRRYRRRSADLGLSLEQQQQEGEQETENNNHHHHHYLFGPPNSNSNRQQYHQQPKRSASASMIENHSRTSLMMKMKGKFRDAANRVRSEQGVVSHWSQEVAQGKAIIRSKRNRELFQGAVNKVTKEGEVVSHWSKETKETKEAAERRKQKLRGVFNTVRTEVGVTRFISKEAEESKKRQALLDQERRRDKIKGAIRKIRMEQGVVSTWEDGVVDSKINKFKDRAQDEREEKEKQELIEQSLSPSRRGSSLVVVDHDEMGVNSAPVIQLAENSILKPLPQMSFKPLLRTKNYSTTISTANNSSSHNAVSTSVTVSPLKKASAVEPLTKTSLPSTTTTARLSSSSSLLKSLPPPPASVNIPKIAPLPVPQQQQKQQSASIPHVVTVAAASSSPKKVHFQFVEGNNTRDDDENIASSASSSSSSMPSAVLDQDQNEYS